MSNYKFIKDYESLGNFMRILPNLQENEVFFGCLFSRKKYGASEDSMLKRFYFDKNSCLRKLRQLETAENSYIDKNGVGFKNEHLVVCMNPSPRDLEKAAYNTIIEVTAKLKNKSFVNPVAESMRQIQKARSKRSFIHFDIDDSSFNFNRLNGILNKESFFVVQTRGGYHLLIDPTLIKDEFKKTFYQNIQKLEVVDVAGDQLIPIVGCNQGGFTPNLFK